MESYGCLCLEIEFLVCKTISKGLMITPLSPQRGNALDNILV